MLQLPPVVLQLPPLAVNLRLPLPLLLTGWTEGAQDPAWAPRRHPEPTQGPVRSGPASAVKGAHVAHWPSTCLRVKAGFYSTLPQFPHLHKGYRVCVLKMKGISVFSFVGNCQQALLSCMSSRLSVGNP